MFDFLLIEIVQTKLRPVNPEDNAVSVEKIRVNGNKGWLNGKKMCLAYCIFLGAVRYL